MPTSAQPHGSPGENPGKSRLEREIEEILEKTEREHPLPPPTPIRPDIEEAEHPLARLRERMSLPELGDVGDTMRQMLQTMPLFVALMLAIVAWMIGDLSPFIAHIVAIASVVALFWPVFRASRAPAAPEKTWRGQTYTGRQDPPQSALRFREWLRQRGILK